MPYQFAIPSSDQSLPNSSDATASRFATASTAEELEKAIEAIKAGELDAVQCVGEIAKPLSDTFRSLIGKKKQEVDTLGVVVDSVSAVQPIVADNFELLKNATRTVAKGHLSDAAKTMSGFRMEHPYLFGAKVAISIASFAQRYLFSKRVDDEVIGCMPFGRLCVEMKKLGFKMDDNVVHSVTIWNGQGPVPKKPRLSIVS